MRSQDGGMNIYIYTWFYFVCVSVCLYVCIRTAWVPSAREVQKRASDPLKTGLQGGWELPRSGELNWDPLQKHQQFESLNHRSLPSQRLLRVNEISKSKSLYPHSLKTPAYLIRLLGTFIGLLPTVLWIALGFCFCVSQRKPDGRWPLSRVSPPSCIQSSPL